MVYKWNGFRYNATAEQAAEIFSQIEKRDGELTAEAIVEESKPKKSVLHKDFEWDDAVAGEKYRIHQAKKMIRCLTCVMETEEKQDVEYRAYLNVSDGLQQSRVINLNAAMESEETREVILKNAYRELEIFRSKYSKYAELEKVMDAINQTI